MTDEEITETARELMTEFNRCCRIGSLDGGQLAYSAEGPGEWFPASTRITATPGVFALPVHVNRGKLSLREAKRCIRLAAEGRPWEPEDDDPDCE
jgi:hypothetical protein